MIDYSVGLEDITTLTAPMWEACGIECPVMIGATCPGKDTSRYMDGPADAAHLRMSCPGWSAKFPNAAAEVVWSWSLESGQDDSAGTTEFGGNWYALFVADSTAPENGPMGAGVILCVQSGGAVELSCFDTKTELDEVWEGIVKENEEPEDEE